MSDAAKLALVREFRTPDDVAPDIDHMLAEITRLRARLAEVEHELDEANRWADDRDEAVAEKLAAKDCSQMLEAALSDAGVRIRSLEAALLRLHFSFGQPFCVVCGKAALAPAAEEPKP